MNLISSSSKKFYALVLIGALSLSSTSEMNAGFSQYITPKNVGLTLALLTIIRLTLKDKPTPESERITYENISEKRVTTKLTPIKFWLQAFDDIVLGYAGKGDGIKVSGKDVKICGEMVITDKKAADKNGDRKEADLAFHQYKAIPPYGVAGSAWFYVKTLSKGLADVKDIATTAVLIGLTYNAVDWQAAGKAGGFLKA